MSTLSEVEGAIGAESRTEEVVVVPETIDPAGVKSFASPLRRNVESGTRGRNTNAGNSHLNA
jgi:hypothetical protein